MDQNGNQLQSLGICRRLFNVIVASLSALALKPMTLGSPLCHCLDICHRLFNLIMQSLSAQAVKPVMLGHPSCHGLAEVPNPNSSCHSAGCMGDQIVHPGTHGTLCDGAGLRAKAEGEQAEGPENSTQISTFSSSSHDFEKDSKGLLPVQDIGDSISSHLSHIQEKNDSYGTLKQAENREKGQEELVPTSTATLQASVPKKTVSFDDRTEVMGFSTKKNKKTERSNSGEKLQEPRPLRSIMKVGSNVNENTIIEPRGEVA